MLLIFASKNKLLGLGFGVGVGTGVGAGGWAAELINFHKAGDFGVQVACDTCDIKHT